MAWIVSIVNTPPKIYALSVLDVIVVLCVGILRGLIRLAMRAMLFGIVGVAVLGLIYYFL